MTTTSSQDSLPAPSSGEEGPITHAPTPGWRLTLGAIGIVYGDIGTSPIYAFRESVGHVMQGGAAAQRAEIVGVISLMLWSLTVIVLIKYVLILLRLDNRGEGGVLALMALVQRKLGRRTPLLFALGVAGAGLFFGDAILTPAISVLSAVEGLAVLPALEGRIEPFVLPIALAILIALFLVQKVGTGVVGGWFGPVCAVWFISMALLGLLHLREDWGVLTALNPAAAVGFLVSHGPLGFVVLGSVFLTVTGAEALYADLGHFGRKPISIAWIFFVFPMLSLNYLGQGAMVLAAPETASQPFFLMAPDVVRPALVIIATMATIIASQAVISGAYSLTRQAIQLGLLPRLEIVQTSASQSGQIYMPQVNLLLMIGSVGVAAGFGSSGELAGAYGVSVIGAMITTTVLATLAIWRVFERPLWLALVITGPILAIELVFLASNLLKLGDGGVVPLLLGGAIIVVMWTWARGSALLVARSRREESFAEVLRSLEREPIRRVPGTAVFLTADPATAPRAFMHNIKHNKVMHERLVAVSVLTTSTPLAAPEERVRVEEIRPDAHRIVLTFGFMETPNVSRALASIRPQGKPYEPMTTSYFLSRRTLIPTAKSGMPLWQDRLYILLAKNATSATDFFRIPSWRVVELGSQEFL